MSRRRKARQPTQDYSNDDHDVGYGHPPTHSQFKPGHSGNPKGRPRRKQEGQLSEMLGKELYRKLRIRENGVTYSIPALQLGARNLMIAAAKGDPSSFMAALKIGKELDRDTAIKLAKMPPMTESERAARIMEILQRALLRKDAAEAAAKRRKAQNGGASQLADEGKASSATPKRRKSR